MTMSSSNAVLEHEKKLWSEKREVNFVAVPPIGVMAKHAAHLHSCTQSASTQTRARTCELSDMDKLSDVTAPAVEKFR